MSQLGSSDEDLCLHEMEGCWRCLPGSEMETRNIHPEHGIDCGIIMHGPLEINVSSACKHRRLISNVCSGCDCDTHW